MKIKKIQWGNKFIWNGCERYFKELPFNMAALVRETYSEFYAWSIRQGTKVIASGKADTIDKAKASLMKMELLNLTECQSTGISLLIIVLLPLRNSTLFENNRNKELTLLAPYSIL